MFVFVLWFNWKKIEFEMGKEYNNLIFMKNAE